MKKYHAKYKESMEDNAEFWRKQALELLHWTEPFTMVHTG
jgi:hypothetical protein